MGCCEIGCDKPAVFVVTPIKAYDAVFCYCTDHLTAGAMFAPYDGGRSWTVEFVGHLSDCATHNAPAEPVGACDCGAPGKV